MRFWDL